MRHDPRASVIRASEFAAALGYRITESDMLDFDIDPELMLRFAGYGEEVEVYFRPNPATGYLRFHRGEHVFDYSADRIASWARVKESLELFRETALELGWSVDREPDQE